MTLRLSTGTRNALASGIGFGALFNKGSINIYTGTQPTNADAAATGTLLGVVTLGGGALTQEVQAAGSLTLSGGGGSVDTVTVNGFNIIPNTPVPYNGSVNQTALDLAAAINRAGYYLASATGSSGVVTLKALPGTGAVHNTYAVSATSTTLSVGTFVAMSGGVNPVNGLLFTDAANGAVTKMGSWSFTGLSVSTQTAGWFRLQGSTVDAGGLATAAPWPARVDGSVGTSGADLLLSNISIALGQVTTVDTFSLTVPAQ